MSVIVHILLVSAPSGWVGLVAHAGFVVGGRVGLVPLVWLVKLRFSPLMDRPMSGGVFWSACGLSITLGILSADGWVGIPIFLVCHEASSAGWS